MMEPLSFFLQEIFVDRFAVNEFDQFESDRTDIEKGTFPAISRRFAVIRCIGIVYVPIFDRAADPDDLLQVRVGAATAREIGWSRP